VEILIDYQVRLINFPPGKAKEAVTENEDGTYTIFIEAALSREKQKEKFFHAMKHILQSDFDKFNADQVELDARNTEMTLDF